MVCGVPPKGVPVYPAGIMLGTLASNGAASMTFAPESLLAPPAPVSAASDTSWPAVPVIPPVNAPPADAISEDEPPCPPDEGLRTPAPPPSCIDEALPAVLPTTGSASEAEHPIDAAMV